MCTSCMFLKIGNLSVWGREVEEIVCDRVNGFGVQSDGGWLNPNRKASRGGVITSFTYSITNF